MLSPRYSSTTKTYTLPLHDALPIFLRPHETEEARRHAALRYLSRPIASHAPRIAETAIELAKLARLLPAVVDRKSTRLNSSHLGISYAVFCLKKKTNTKLTQRYNAA